MIRPAFAALLMFLVSGLAAVPAQAGVADTLQAKAHECEQKIRDADQRQICMIQITPRKCRDFPRGRRGKFHSPVVRKNWLLCASTCEGAGLVSRTVGECSMPADPKK